jgi:hypothetical protein
MPLGQPPTAAWRHRPALRRARPLVRPVAQPPLGTPGTTANPDEHPLWLLQQMSNIDKHRIVLAPVPHFHSLVSGSGEWTMHEPIVQASRGHAPPRRLADHHPGARRAGAGRGAERGLAQAGVLGRVHQRARLELLRPRCCAAAPSGPASTPASEVSRKRRRSMPGWWGGCARRSTWVRAFRLPSEFRVDGVR